MMATYLQRTLLQIHEKRLEFNPADRFDGFDIENELAEGQVDACIGDARRILIDHLKVYKTNKQGQSSKIDPRNLQIGTKHICILVNPFPKTNGHSLYAHRAHSFGLGR